MPSLAQPVIYSIVPLNPTSAAVDITPPASGGPWTYRVTLCPRPSGACVSANCTDPHNCIILGLQPGAAYEATVREF